MRFNNSVISFPSRGEWGKSNYRGNCSGHVIKGFWETYHKRKDGLACDPSIGGGTSVDVARDLGLRFKGTDLHQGFNLLIDDFKNFLGEEAHTCFWHPPYLDMIHYSGNMWGEADKWDMSRMKMGEFVESLELALLNIHASVERGGVYGILMGNLRRNGEYFNLSSLVERVAPGKLIDEIIKVQHNCVSDSRDYRGNIVKIGHEKLLCFRVSGPALFLLSKMENRAAAMVGITWRAAVRRVLQGGKVMHLKEIERELQPYIETRSNNNADAKIRQICQDDRYFVRTAPGTYKLAA